MNKNVYDHTINRLYSINLYMYFYLQRHAAKDVDNGFIEKKVHIFNMDVHKAVNIFSMKLFFKYIFIYFLNNKPF